MANINCSSCAELRETAPSLIVNGFDDTMCTSLENNTGLNPSSGNDNCTDLNNMNDCLVGNMDSEIDAYEVCDWKEFMHKFIPNVWTVLKGIICAVCGLWTRVQSFDSKQSAMCDLLSATLSHPVSHYGILPNSTTASHKGGTIATKNGSPILTPLPRSEVSSDAAWTMQNVGIKYGKLTGINCDGACRRYEWIAPDVYAYRFNANVTPAAGDLLWSIDKASVTGRMGMTDEMWEIRKNNPIAWVADWTAGNKALIGLRLSVEDERLCLRFTGCIGATYAELSGQTLNPPADQAERLYQFTC